MTVDRFRTAQKDGEFDRAYKEIRQGMKRSHWMWYIFPQLKGLGSSSMSQYYGLDGPAEAREFWSDRILRERLTTITGEILNHSDKSAEEIFGTVDAKKLRSCMTLFEMVTGEPVFSRVLDEFFDGERDERTVFLLTGVDKDPPATYEENAAVFRDTIRMCMDSERLSKSIRCSIENQQYILGDTDIGPRDDNEFDTYVDVVAERTLQAASRYSGRVCVLNFANAYTPGGCAEMGTGTQEEALCRCSTLYPCISTEEAMERFYRPHGSEAMPFGFSDIIYTPDVIVFKTDTNHPVVLDADRWFHVDVITCAAPDIRWIDVDEMQLSPVFQDRFLRIIDAAAMNGVDVLILGAFGCGIFGNDPVLVADCAKTTILKTYGRIGKIVFAIPFSGRDMNYSVFRNALESLQEYRD